MQFISTLLTILATVSAQQVVNQILNPGANSVIQAGGGVQSITWSNLSSGNVSVALYSGSNPVVTVAPLAANIANTGTYLWTPETWLPSGNDYTIGIVDLSGTAPTQYSPFFTVQLCSTCSSSTRSTTSSFSAQTVSVSGLDIGTRTAAAFPMLASVAATASGAAVSSGVAASGSGMSMAMAAGATLSAVSGSAATASLASVLGASQNAILSQTGSLAPTGTAGASTTTAKSDASVHKAAALAALLVAVVAAIV